jgi:hypothetical protein
MTDEELIARLRESQSYEWQDPIWEARIVAADRIEALTKERDEAREYAGEVRKREMAAEDARISATDKLAKAVEALEDIVKDCEADYPPSHGAIKYFAIAILALIGENK